MKQPCTNDVFGVTNRVLRLALFSLTSAKMETEENTQRWFVNGG